MKEPQIIKQSSSIITAAVINISATSMHTQTF